MSATHIIHSQLLYELSIWKKEIDKIRQDNFEMKNQLIFLLRHLNGKELLESIEKYQTLFILQDRLIEILRHDVFHQSKTLHAELFENKFSTKQMRLHRKIRSDIRLCEKGISSIKEEFDAFLKIHHTKE